jgi:hypothetical protein
VGGERGAEEDAKTVTLILYKQIMKNLLKILNKATPLKMLSGFSLLTAMYILWEISFLKTHKGLGLIIIIFCLVTFAVGLLFDYLLIRQFEGNKRKVWISELIISALFFIILLFE